MNTEVKPQSKKQSRYTTRRARSFVLAAAALVAIAAVLTVLAFIPGHTVTGHASLAPHVNRAPVATRGPQAGTHPEPVGPDAKNAPATGGGPDGTGHLPNAAQSEREAYVVGSAIQQIGSAVGDLFTDTDAIPGIGPATR